MKHGSVATRRAVPLRSGVGGTAGPWCGWVFGGGTGGVSPRSARGGARSQNWQPANDHRILLSPRRNRRGRTICVWLHAQAQSSWLVRMTGDYARLLCQASVMLKPQRLLRPSRVLSSVGPTPVGIVCLALVACNQGPVHDIRATEASQSGRSGAQGSADDTDPQTPVGDVIEAGSEKPSEVKDTSPEDPAPKPDVPLDAGATDSDDAPTAVGVTPDAGADKPDGNSTGDAGRAGGDAGSPCSVEACVDHGACIDVTYGTLCDCAVESLPKCELPLFREIGPARSNSELLLTTMSYDGSTIVGTHVPRYAPESTIPVPVKWTLDGGLEILPQDPAGPTKASGVNKDGTLIFGDVEPADGSQPYEVVWRDGVLDTRGEDDVRSAYGKFPRLEEVQELLGDLGLAGGWTLFSANHSSGDGKSIFGHGCSPTVCARWLLRLP